MSDSYTKGLKVDGRIGDLISGSYSDGFNDGYKQGRVDAIDEIENGINEIFSKYVLNSWETTRLAIADYFEQMKEQKDDR